MQMGVIIAAQIAQSGDWKTENTITTTVEVQILNGCHICKTLDFSAEDEATLFGDTKTFNSQRTIKISQSIISDLKQHIKYQNQNKLA